MSLSKKALKELKAKAHTLKPVIRIGQKGITENLINETDSALNIHELIKVHIANDDRDERKSAGEELAEKTRAEMVNRIGKTCILYRQRPDEA